jgi:hypothetical protein
MRKGQVLRLYIYQALDLLFSAIWRWSYMLAVSNCNKHVRYIYEIPSEMPYIIPGLSSFMMLLTRHVCFNYKIETTSVCATWIRSWSEKYTIQINIKLHVICRWVYYSAISTNKTRIHLSSSRFVVFSNLKMIIHVSSL